MLNVLKTNPAHFRNLHSATVAAYVRALFPHVAVSHIKQVLAYKCKECAAAVAHRYNKPIDANPNTRGANP